MHPTCGVLSCCQRKGIEYCSLCEEYPCKKYDGAGSSDSFISHKNRLRDLDKIKQIGAEAYEAELNEKIGLLEELLNNYDDGRRKSFYCVAVNVLDLQDIKAVMGKTTDVIKTDTAIKEKAVTVVRLFEEMSVTRDISLKLRK